jgi:hypothetical protein
MFEQGGDPCRAKQGIVEGLCLVEVVGADRAVAQSYHCILPSFPVALSVSCGGTIRPTHRDGATLDHGTVTEACGDEVG